MQLGIEVVACWACTFCAALLPFLTVFHRKHVLLLCFYAESWVYLFLIPTLNVTFPQSDFANPPDVHRYIAFTPDIVATYAGLQWGLLALFMVPMVFVYRRFVKGLAPPESPPRNVSALHLYAYACASSVIALAYLVIGLRRGLLSPYAITPEALLELPRYEFACLRLYALIYGPLLWIFGSALSGTMPTRQRVIALALFSPALAGAIVRLTTTRLGLVSVLVVFLTTVRIGRLSTVRRTAMLVLAVAVILVGFRYIPIVRTELAQAGDFSTTSANDLAKDVAARNDVILDFGARLDGLEVIALSTPGILRNGPLYMADMPFKALLPLSPLFPGLEAELKSGAQERTQKTSYLAPYTEIREMDYPTVGLTEAYANLWVFGFPLYATIFSIAMAAVVRSLTLSRTYLATTVSYFLLWHILFFERDFSDLLFGWTRYVPIVILLQALKLWRSGSSRLGDVEGAEVTDRGATSGTSEEPRRSTGAVPFVT